MLTKLLGWLPANLAGVLGIIQAVIKLIKEILTLVVDILYPIIPSKQFKKVIDTVRGIVNKIDEWIEKIKGFFLKITSK